MNNKFLSKVFGWMVIGLLVTFGTGFLVSSNENILINVLSGPGLLGILVIEIAVVLFLSFRITKMSPSVAKACFILYSFVNGLFFSTYFVEFQVASLIYVFLITAIVFAVFALIGATTKMDLTKIGSYLFMGLLAIIICGIINIFVGSSSFDFGLSILAVILFLGYTAYDVKVIMNSDKFVAVPEENLAIYGALQLYLDFINLFIRLIEFFGKRNDN
ncbi:uncharacterized UPF0005 family protein [Mycoplasma sp. CAG:956]|nr:uncharacterized UPF0005 family protein [Mycoplasma sp. CAG:956]